jgi:hypothetical protein
MKGEEMTKIGAPMKRTNPGDPVPSFDAASPLMPFQKPTAAPDGLTEAEYNRVHRRKTSAVPGPRPKSRGNYLTNSRGKKTDVRTLG